MKRVLAKCGLCGSLVKLTKSGMIPDHRVVHWNGDRRRNRCNGVRDGINIAFAATAAPVEHYWRGQARAKALRYHQAGKSTANDPAQRHRWLYRNGWLPEQLARQWDQVYPWNYQIKYGRSYT